MTKKCPLNNFENCKKHECAWYMVFEGFGEDVNQCAILIMGQVMDSLPSAIKKSSG